MKTFKFSLALRTRKNTDVFITLDENIYGIHHKRVNILFIQYNLLDCDIHIYLLITNWYFLFIIYFRTLRIYVACVISYNDISMTMEIVW